MGSNRWGRTFLQQVSKSFKKCQTLPITIGPFSKSATNAPNITIAIFGAFVPDFENCLNIICTFWHFLKLLGTFCKKVRPHLFDPIWKFPKHVDRFSWKYRLISQNSILDPIRFIFLFDLRHYVFFQF